MVALSLALRPDLMLSFAVTCPSAGSGRPDNGSMTYGGDPGLQQFEKWWDKSRTVPFYLIGLLLPLLNFKSPSFFSKFNILGELRRRDRASGPGEEARPLGRGCLPGLLLSVWFVPTLPGSGLFLVEFGTEEKVDDRLNPRPFKDSQWVPTGPSLGEHPLVPSASWVPGGNGQDFRGRDPRSMLEGLSVPKVGTH